MKPRQMCYWRDRQTECVKQMARQFRRSGPTMSADPLDPRPLVDSVGDQVLKPSYAVTTKSTLARTSSGIE